MRELIVPLKSELDCNTERFHAHDGHGADQRTNAHVDDGVYAAAAGCETVYGIEGVEDYEEEVGQKHFPPGKSVP